MAGSAALFQVLPGQGKTGRRMIKINISPAVFVMAYCTFSVRIIPGFYFPLVNIIVTLFAAEPYIPETPSVLLFMTISARDSLM
jgi:hypothetical protein